MNKNKLIIEFNKMKVKIYLDKPKGTPLPMETDRIKAEFKVFLLKALKLQKIEIWQEVEKKETPKMKENYFKALPDIRGVWSAGYSSARAEIAEMIRHLYT